MVNLIYKSIFLLSKNIFFLNIIKFMFFRSGPIASMLVNRYGCRLVTIVGAICAAIGLTISAASKSLILLYLSIGVLTGLSITNGVG